MSPTTAGSSQSARSCAEARAALVRYGRRLVADDLVVSAFCVAVGTICDEIPAVHYSVLRLGGPTVRVAPYTTFGSDGLAANVAAALEDRSAALLQNHGAVAYGTTLQEAYDRVQLLEWLAEVYWRARLAGTPRILSAAELDAHREQARRHRYRGGGA
ncbi:MAG TPA: class II aldolase/adducin family protein [Streptosporangiaceae bacterium]|nr:class II aldolase/adducin family protein [Streptosporangiaceae bacterium]